MEAPRQPVEQMFTIVSNYWIARAVHAGTALGLPDRLADAPKTAKELAELTGSDPRSLNRLLRALTGIGLFQTDGHGHYTTTELGDTLRTDTPGSLASFIQMELGDAHHSAWGQLLHAVRTGEPGFEKALGTKIWDFFESNPAMSDHLGQAMTGLTTMVANAVIDAHDFSPYRKIIDIGGGEGGFLATILTTHPKTSGVLFDLPHVVANDRARDATANLAGRCERVGGNFFENVPAGGDLYTMKWILHDWDDESSLEILKSCRRAMPKDARLLIIDTVVPDGDDFSPSKIIDLNMMVLSGGQERTVDEFRYLLSAAGFTLTSVWPTRSPSSLIQAVPTPAG